MSEERIKQLVANIQNDQIVYSRSESGDHSSSFNFDKAFRNHKDGEWLREIIEFDKQANRELFVALHDANRFAIAHVLLLAINGWRLGGHSSATGRTEGHFADLPFQIGEDDKLIFPKSGIPIVVARWGRSSEVFGLLSLDDSGTKMSDAEHPSPRFAGAPTNFQICVGEIWSRLDNILAEVAPAVFQTLRPGAAESEIKQIEHEQLRFRLPQDVRESLKCHNGQTTNELGLVNGFSLCTTQQIGRWREENDNLQKLIDQENLAPGIHRGEHLIVAMHFESEFVALDCNGEGGKSGQLYVLEDDLFSDTPISSSWGKFLMTFLEKLTNGDQTTLLDGIQIEFSESF